ncbi:MAG: tripartite tricarboxylate transporter TctB family protein [Pseudolabrys sp.]
MAEGSDNEDSANAVVSNRVMNMAVAVALMAVALVILISSYRLGAGWAKDVGPDSGYFPFYIALFLLIASGVIFVQSLMSRSAGGGFIAGSELRMMLSVLIPMSIFVVLSIYIGIYISTFMFICFFMMWLGKYPLFKTVPIAIVVPIVMFVVFEMWFLVPLPKGPFEAWLGY